MKTTKCDIGSACFFGDIHSACRSLTGALAGQDNEAAFLLIAVRNKEKNSADLGEYEYFGAMQKYKPEMMGLQDYETSEILAKATVDFLMKQRPRFKDQVLEEIRQRMNKDDRYIIIRKRITEIEIEGDE
jgi:hypothetical protein